MTTTNLTSQQIDTGLLPGGPNGTKWPGTTITFSIPGAGALWDPAYSTAGKGEPFNANYSTLSADQAASFKLAISYWDSYIAPSMPQVSDTTPGDIRVAFTDAQANGGDAYAYAYFPATVSTDFVGGDVWIDYRNKGETLAQGTYGFQVLLHELGHSLGLKHPQDAPVIPNGPNGESYNSYAYSLMSYTPPDYKHNITVTPTSVSDPNNVTVDLTPMVVDIQAVQDLYGADKTTATGNDIYRFTDADFDGRRSIYDAAGIDTLDFSQISRGSQIDLRPGANSDIAYFSKEAQEAAILAANPQLASDQGSKTFIHNSLNDPNRPDYEWTKNLGIAFATTIENVIGTVKADTIVANSVANVVTGGGGADVITGGGGADTFRDTAANLNGDMVTDFLASDLVHVTDATAALTSLSFSASTLSFALAGSSTTSSLTLTGAYAGPAFQRADASGGVDIYFGQTIGDHNGDRTSDVLLQNGGHVVTWSVGNGQVSGTTVVSGAGAADYAVVGKGDFNNDGTSDILLQNGGTLVEWLMKNGAYSSGAVLSTSAAGYTIKGTGDFNGDGLADVVMQNGTTVAVLAGQASPTDTRPGALTTTLESGFTVVGTGDFNGDGTADILLQNGGTIVDWIMKNGQVQSTHVVGTGATGFAVVGTGDFNGDGTTDILLRNGGTIVDWTMKNGTYASGSTIGSGADAYTVAGTGDFNGDGMTDVLLQNGQNVVDWQVLNGRLASATVVSAGLHDYHIV